MAAVVSSVIIVPPPTPPKKVVYGSLAVAKRSGKTRFVARKATR